MEQRGVEAGDPRRPRWVSTLHLVYCVIECSWLLPLAGLRRAQKVGLRGFANPSQHSRSRAAGSGRGRRGRGLVQAAAQEAGGRAVERAPWRLSFDS